ncbi:MAG: M20/M25/M40 family metallo-hydrolase [Myxococcota bacterium]|nr:M20/M25/M40 family metallo-hydrolase [Myxococcota bacterium]MEE2779912.1 M20/M25/M40 family metallo-hydrolase [Myxococcota bacterium]
MVDAAAQSNKSPEQLFAEQLIAHCTGNRRTIEALLEALVKVESPTGHREGLAKCLEVMEGGFSSMGFTTAMLGGSKNSQHLLARRPGGDGAPTILLMGHVDTVFEAGGPFSDFKRDGDRAMGPGVGAKGGSVCILALLDALKPLGLLDAFDFRVLITTDGESMSETSATLVSKVASGSEIALIFEASSEAGSLIKGRTGAGQFEFSVAGRTAQMSGNVLAGRNAILELAHKIPQIDTITHPKSGVVANCALIQGGQKARLVPDRARLVVDVTCKTPESVAGVKTRLQQIADDVMMDGCVTTLSGEFARSPWPEHPHTNELLEIWAETGRTFGIQNLTGEIGGSAGDANHVFAAGVPVLDGLGPISGGSQTTAEWVDLGSIVQRTALNAMSLVTWLHRRAQGIWRPKTG